MEKSRSKPLFKIIGILLIISVATSLILSYLIKSDKSFIARFSDNMFISGTGILIAGIFFGLRERAVVFANRELFKNNKTIEKAKKKLMRKNYKTKNGLKSSKEKAILRKELFSLLYKTFLATGFICFLISIIMIIFS